MGFLISPYSETPAGSSGVSRFFQPDGMCREQVGCLEAGAVAERERRKGRAAQSGLPGFRLLVTCFAGRGVPTRSFGFTHVLHLFTAEAGPFWQTKLTRIQIRKQGRRTIGGLLGKWMGFPGKWVLSPIQTGGTHLFSTFTRTPLRRARVFDGHPGALSWGKRRQGKQLRPANLAGLEGAMGRVFAVWGDAPHGRRVPSQMVQVMTWWLPANRFLRLLDLLVGLVVGFPFHQLKVGHF